MDSLASPQWEQLWLPFFPLASDDLLAGVYRHSRQEALGLRYIEANPEAVSNLLVVDIDHGDAALRALGTRPLPHVIVETPKNGHAHAVWALRAPIPRTEYARRKPLAFAAAVTEGLRRAVDGDKGYSGLLTKNPIHQAWWTYAVADSNTLYSLDELAAGLGDDMPPARWRQTKTYRANPAGLGRNCAIFESARIWAYREARLIRLRNEYPTRQDTIALSNAITMHVNELNTAYSEPLPQSETNAIAGSIHRWITHKFTGWTDSRTVNQATFITIQSARGKRSGKTRLTSCFTDFERFLIGKEPE